MLLRHYLEQGRTKEALAQELGISRRTIYNWIETGQLDRDCGFQPIPATDSDGIRPPIPGDSSH